MLVDAVDDAELKARVSRALERRSLDAPRLKIFYYDMAEAADSSVSSIKNWMREVCAPDAAALINLFENVPGFEAEVRGAPSPQDSQAQAVIEAVEEVLADARKEIGGGLRAVPNVK